MMRLSCLLVVLALLVGIAGCSKSEHDAPGTPQSSESPFAQPQAESETGEAKNQPPRITSIDVTPLYPTAGDTLTVRVLTEDPDGDTVSLSYRWHKNGEPLPIPVTSESLQLSQEFKRGDKILLTVAPSDGKAEGPVGRMEVTIGNASPDIKSSPTGGSLANRIFTYQVVAVDKDKDALSYSLKSAPPGMTIHTSTGLIQWSVPPEYSGRADATVIVSDGQGGESMQTFALEINPQK